MEWEVAVGQIIERNWNNNNNNNNSYFCRYRVINGKGKSKEIEKSRVGLFSSFRKGHNKHKEALSLSLNADGSDHFISKQNKTESLTNSHPLTGLSSLSLSTFIIIFQFKYFCVLLCKDLHLGLLVALWHIHFFFLGIVIT